jgi:hypothetical protein
VVLSGLVVGPGQSLARRSGAPTRPSR